MESVLDKSIFDFSFLGKLVFQLVRSMNMKPDEFAAFLRSGALNAAPTVTPYHKQEDAADET